MNLGTGIAAGIVVRGELVEGAHGAAGEVGYLVSSAAALASLPAGSAPLEEVIGGRGVETWASAELGEPVTMAGLMTRNDSGGALTSLRQRFLAEVGVLVANLTIVFDPDLVVLGGGLMRSGERVLASVRDAIGRAAPFEAEVVPAHFGAESALFGAGASALDLGRAPASVQSATRRPTGAPD